MKKLRFALWAAFFALAAATAIGCGGGGDDDDPDTSFAYSQFPPFNDSGFNKLDEYAEQDEGEVDLVKIYSGDKRSAFLTYAQTLSNYHGFTCDMSYSSGLMYGYKCLKTGYQPEFGWIGVYHTSHAESAAVWAKAKSGYYLVNMADADGENGAGGASLSRQNGENGFEAFKAVKQGEE